MPDRTKGAASCPIDGEAILACECPASQFVQAVHHEPSELNEAAR
jgi:hypothetical protein